MGHTEVAPQVLLHVTALLVADHHDGPFTKAGPSADDSLVVAVAPVPLEFEPVGKDGLDIVQGVWTPGMTRHLHLLHRVQVPIGLFTQVFELGGQHPDFVAYVQAPLRRHLAQSHDLALHLDDVALECEVRRG